MFLQRFFLGIASLARSTPYGWGRLACIFYVRTNRSIPTLVRVEYFVNLPLHASVSINLSHILLLTHASASHVFVLVHIVANTTFDEGQLERTLTKCVFFKPKPVFLIILEVLDSGVVSQWALQKKRTNLRTLSCVLYTIPRDLSRVAAISGMSYSVENMSKMIRHFFRRKLTWVRHALEWSRTDCKIEQGSSILLIIKYL